MKNLLSILLGVLGNLLFSQNNSIIMQVNGKNDIPLFSKSTFYIDSSNSKTVAQIDRIRDQFTRINNVNLIQKKQPNVIWTHTYIKNTGDAKEYWLGMYSQLDSLCVYKKIDNRFVLINKSDMSDFRKLKNPNVRFHFTPVTLNKNELLEIYMKINNSRHFQNSYADFTTPEDNLIWETGFYWEIAFVVGAATIIVLLSLMLGVLLRRKHYFLYAIYLTLIATIVIREELFISMIKIPLIYDLVFHSNSLFLLVIAMGLSIKIFTDLIEIQKMNKKVYRLLDIIFGTYVMVGSLVSIWYYFDYENANFNNYFYILIWDFAVILLESSVILEIGLVIFLFSRRKKMLIGIIVALFYGFFNPVSYFLNYSRILTIYKISHPNYFYYILFLEIFVLGIAIAYNYRQIRFKYIGTLEDKLKLEEENSKIKELQEEKIKQSIIESHEHLLKSLSKDLHDDIGQKLSVINFSVENLKFVQPSKESVKEIRNTVLEISNSVRNLSHWLNDFSIGKKSIDEIIHNEITRLNKSNLININFKKIENTAGNYETSIEENIILYRCFQECFNNILKHSGANLVKITIDYTNIISICLADNGKGFDAKNTFGNGINNLKERTNIIGFSCEIESEPTKGTKILIYKP